MSQMAEGAAQMPWSPEDGEFQMLDTELFTLLGFGFCFDLTITMPWFFPLRIRTSCVNYGDL